MEVPWLRQLGPTGLDAGLDPLRQPFLTGAVAQQAIPPCLESVCAAWMAGSWRRESFPEIGECKRSDKLP